VAPIIERIDLGCASNLMRIPINLTAPKLLLSAHQTLPKTMIYARV